LSDIIDVYVDTGKIDDVLKRLKPRRAGVAAPDGLQGAARLVHDHLKDEGVEPVIILDPTYGFCDLQDQQAEALGLDVVFNLGHFSPVDLSRDTVLIDVEYLLPDGRLRELAAELSRRAVERGWRSIGLFSTSNYGKARRSLARFLEEAGIGVQPGDDEKIGPLFAWQITGCMFPGPWKHGSAVDGMAFLGSSRFHAIAMRAATGRTTLLLDPESIEVSDVEDDAIMMERRAALAIYRAIDARSFGIVVGEKTGQRYVGLARALGSALERLGRSVYYYSLYEITADRLGAVQYVDAFIALACPRIGLDGVGMDRPVLAYPQAAQLLRMLRGKSLNMDELLRMPLWAWVGYDR